MADIIKDKKEQNMTMNKMFRMTIDMPREDHTRLKAISALKGITMRELILSSVREKIQHATDGKEATIEAIKNAKEGKNLVECVDARDLFKKLGI